jgi:hypothetical protein
MTIRFLQTVPSQNPEYPFQAGQIIYMAAPSGFLLQFVDGIRAIAIPEDQEERAVEAPADRPEPVRRKRGRPRRVD